MRRRERGYTDDVIPGGEEDRGREISTFPVVSFHRNSLTSNVEEKKKTEKKLTLTAAMTHLLFCNRNENLHTLVV